MAGQLKRENPDIQEDLVLIRALRDSNLPKFLADDAVLFKVNICMKQLVQHKYPIKSAAIEARTHDLQIMRLTRCQLR